MPATAIVLGVAATYAFDGGVLDNLLGGILMAGAVSAFATLRPRVIDNVEVGPTLCTDALKFYTGLDIAFSHETIDHAERHPDGKVHTNTIENFWSLVKRGLNGTYVSVEPFHLFRYLDERVFTFNERDRTDYGRFDALVGAIAGRRLTYAEVTGER